MITFEDFEKVDVWVGKILEVNEFLEAKKPSYKLKIDFGEDVGIKQSSVQIKHLYKKGDLIGRQVIAVVNFPPKQIANFMSEVLTLGVPDKDGRVVLLIPEREVDLGARMF